MARLQQIVNLLADVHTVIFSPHTKTLFSIHYIVTLTGSLQSINSYDNIFTPVSTYSMTELDIYTPSIGYNTVSPKLIWTSDSRQAMTNKFQAQYVESDFSTHEDNR